MNCGEIRAFEDWLSSGRLISVVMRLRCLMIVFNFLEKFLDFSSVFVLRLILQYPILYLQYLHPVVMQKLHNINLV